MRNVLIYNRATLACLISIMVIPTSVSAAEVSITMDDPNLYSGPVLTGVERNNRILSALEKHRVKGVLFVCGKRIDSSEGKSLLASWVAAGHAFGNHSYSHESYGSKEMTFESFSSDVSRAESIIPFVSGHPRWFRFPFLKEGDSALKRDRMRGFLRDRGYSNGYVTIDASDWYISDRLTERLQKNPKADLAPYREFYLNHIWDRALYYHGLSKKVLGREVKHTLLIHHNLLNALFLDDLLAMFKNKGWKLISAQDAFVDPVFKLEPNIAPMGESIIWALAKETGRFESMLRLFSVGSG
jgi:hypothetical protein